MAKIKDEAMAYEPPQTKNVADLDKVSVDLELQNRTGTDKEGILFNYKVCIVDGEEYRVPNVVLGNLKVILEDNPNITHFKVKKEGEGLKTRYTVIPLILGPKYAGTVQA